MLSASPTHPPGGLPAALAGRDILCFSHDWTGDPLSKTHLMRLLARRNRILWVNSIGYRTPGLNKADFGRMWRKLKAARESLREAEPNLYVLNPLAVPAHGLRAARVFNRWWLRRQVRSAMRALGFSRPINWVFNPAAAILAGRLGEDLLIYQCVDEYTAFSGVATQALLETEAALLRRADLIVVSAARLQAAKRSQTAPTVLVRHGVDYDHFRRALDPATPVPPDLARLPRPVIGYFGLIARDWVDVPLLLHVARSFPAASVALIGKVTTDVSALEREPNVHFLGRQPYEMLPGYCKGFDAALIPFPISDVTLSANPLKAREYLAAGLPVVSTAIPEVEHLGQCLIGRTPDEFVAQLRAALARPGPEEERSRSMSGESWAARLADIEGYLQRVVDNRAHRSRP